MSCNRFTLKLILLFLATSLILSACAWATSTAPNLTSKPQATRTVTLPTLTPTDMPTVAVSPLPLRTLASPKPTETLFFKTTEVAKFSVQCTDVFDMEYHSMISPDGNWLAKPCRDDHNRVLKIVSRDGQLWVLQFQDYLSKKDIENGIPLGNLLPQQWSDDGKFLYFAPFINYSGGGSCFYAINGQGLYRIKVDDGTVSAILPSSSTVMGYLFSISPTGRRVAYLGSGVSTILDLKTGQETIFSNNKAVGGDFTWSQDGLKLAYATCQFKYEQGDYYVSKSSILIYSVQENSTRTILESGENALYISSWNGNMLKIFQRDEYGNENYLFFDLSINQWLTPTPEP
jgi:hypothetical protein